MTIQRPTQRPALRAISACAAVIPLAAVAAIASASGGIGGLGFADCQACIDDKQADPQTVPDYQTKCYPDSGLPPPLKRASCAACLQDLCGNVCGSNHSEEKCGI